jgi:Ca-activated chloride channel homolog
MVRSGTCVLPLSIRVLAIVSFGFLLCMGCSEKRAEVAKNGQAVEVAQPNPPPVSFGGPVPARDGDALRTGGGPGGGHPQPGGMTGKRPLGPPAAGGGGQPASLPRQADGGRSHRLPPSEAKAAQDHPAQGESAGNESYSPIQDNDFLEASAAPLSTFAIDVDTAALSNIRRYLGQGTMPPKDAVRIEEMINYFKYNYPEPTGPHPVGVTTELGTCPWNPDHWLLRVGMKARSIDPSNLPPRNLVFLIDVSGSMGPVNRLPLVKRGLQMLVDQLTDKDRVAIVVYAGSSGLVLPTTRGDRHDLILNVLDRLQAGGSTNGGQGIQLAYRIAKESYIPGGVNRVILATDGDFNVGVTNRGDLLRMIEERRKDNIFLTVLGFGMGNLKDGTLEVLADKGNGHYAYIDDEEEARKVFVTDGAALVAVAKDVKLQIEFNPKVVQGYRLLGYENRVMKSHEFNDDAKSGGAIGAGHTVTALYEVVPVGVKFAFVKTDKLRYQEDVKPNEQTSAAEVAFVKVRYKDPEAETSQLFSQSVPNRLVPYGDCSSDFRFAAGIAGFGMLLRDSPHKGQTTYQLVNNLLRSGRGEDRLGHRAEWIPLAERADEVWRQQR